jgi:hypothetical protein
MRTDTLQGIKRPQPHKITVTTVEEPETLDKHGFTARIEQLTDRLNYSKEYLTAKDRFLRAVRRYNRIGK